MIKFFADNSQEILIGMIGALFGSLISAILAVWFTLWLIEGTKQRNKKRTMMALMSTIAASVRETEQDLKNEKGVIAIFSKFRSETIWAILESDTFDLRRDKELVDKLSRLASQIDSYDEIVSVHNHALAVNREFSNQVYKLLVTCNKQIRATYKEIEPLFDRKSH